MFPRACVALLAIVNWTNLAFSQQEGDEATQAATAKRFLQIIERNPQRGTALEKVFSYHSQRGTLDAFIGDLQQRTQSDPQDGVAWMLLGLFESQRRMDPAAILAFSEAEKLRPNDAFPAFYRGQCLLRMGEPTQAADAFEIAIQRKPTRIILLEVFEQLGRTYLRQNRNDLAIDAWTRLETLFPKDLHVLEQIASIQNQEGDYRNALPRYERLTVLAKEPTQRIQYRIETAQLHIRLGNAAQGLGELEAILSELKPDGWLYRDVQGKIEEDFLKSNDLLGLVQYYEKRLAISPDDIESMVRLCKFLTTSGRLADANRWIVQAIDRAPSRVDLRKTFIEQLLIDKQYAAACEQYAHLSQLDPKNADILRDWGKTVLNDPDRSIEEAKKEASQIWNKMIDPSSEKAVVLIQVADLLKSASMPAEAQTLYERAIELQPEETQYREYFGQFLFDRNQRDKAYQIWDSIAEGPRRNAETLMRLAEIYDHAQQTEKAVVLAEEACLRVQHDSTAYVKTARFQKKAGLMDGALSSLATAGQLAETEEQRELILHLRLDILEATNRLKSETEMLQGQIRRAEKPTLAQWRLLARYLIRQKRWKEASSAVNQALLLDANSQVMLLASAEIAEGLGNAEASIQSLRKLADLDRRKRVEYLERIARQQARYKRFDDAIRTAQEVVQATSTKTESYEFLSQICFQAKKPKLGIEALQKALRITPNSSSLTLALATALSNNEQPGEAIELYWRAFTKASSLDEKIDLSARMVKVYQREERKPKLLANAIPLSELIQRMETARKDPAQRRDLTICLSQLYQSLSDFANAKRLMQELLFDRVRDATILDQVIKICLAEGDLEMAIEYQRQLIAIAPGHDNESFLAGLLRQRGDIEAANEIVLRLLRNEPDLATVLQNVDSLMERGDHELALQVLEPLLLKESNKLELLYRRGIALAGVDRWAESRATWEKILTLDLPRSELVLQPTGGGENANSKQSSPPSKSTEPISLSPDAMLLATSDHPTLTDIALGRLDLTGNHQQRNSWKNWSPQSIGEMRIACIAWLNCCENKGNLGKSDWLRRAIDGVETNGTRAEHIEAMAVAKFQQDLDSQVRIATVLAENGEPEMQRTYMGLLRNRRVSGNASENKNQKPLSDLQLQLMLEAFDTAKEEVEGSALVNANSTPSNVSISSNRSVQLLRQRMMQQNYRIGQIQVPPSLSSGTTFYTNRVQGVWSNPTIFGSPFAFSASTFGAVTRVEGFVPTVVSELRFAGQPERAEEFLRRQCQIANTQFQLSSLCHYLLGVERYREIETPLVRWFELELDQAKENDALASTPAIASPATQTTTTQSTTMQTLQSDDVPMTVALRLLEISDDQLSTDSIIRILDSALAVSNERFFKRRFPPLDAMALGWHETQPKQKRILVHAWCMNLVSEEEQCLLQLVKGIFAKSNRLNDWKNYLLERAKRAESCPAALEQLRFGLASEVSGLFLNESAAVEALETIGRDSECALQAAKALLAHQKFQSARRIADAMTPDNSQDELLKELVVLHASSWLNDKSRTEESIKNLSSQMLDNMTLMSLATPLQRANSMGIAYPPTLVPVNSNKIAPQVQWVQPPIQYPTTAQANANNSVRMKEISKVLKNGDKEEAIKIARQWISKPRTYPSFNPNEIAFSGSSSGRVVQWNRSATATAAESERENAFAILIRWGELDTLISDTELRAQTAPLSFVLHEQLAELYEFAGDKPNAEKATLQALQIRPNASPLRTHYARGLWSSGKTSEACNQFLILLNRDPNSALAIMGEWIELFTTCGRQSELLSAIQSAPFQSVTNRDELLGVAYSILGTPTGLDVGCLMFEKLAQLSPQLRQQALALLFSAGVKTYPRLMNFTLDALIPKENDVLRDPWFGLRASDGTYDEGDAIFEMLLTSNRSEEIEKKLEPAVLAAVERFPNWIAGKVMLQMIAERTNRKTEAQKRLYELASDKRLFIECPRGVALRLATDFVEMPEARKTAIDLISPLVGKGQIAFGDPELQPNFILARLLIADGQRSKAIEMLAQEYESGNANMSAYYSAARTNVSLNAPVTVRSLADKILELKLPYESYRLFEKHPTEPTQTPTQSIQNVRSPSTIQTNGKLTTREVGRLAAIALLQLLPPDKAIFETLQDRSDPNRNYPALELMLQYSIPRLNAINRIESAMQTTLLRHASSGKHSEIEAELKKLLDLHPSDLSILTTQARVQLAAGSSEVANTLREIERICSEFDSDIDQMLSEAKNSPKDSSTPHYVESVFSTWLVARQCLETRQHSAVAEQIAGRALRAATLLELAKSTTIAMNGNTEEKGSSVSASQIGLELANTILLEWGRVLVQRGNTEDGVAKWSELIAKLGGEEKKADPWTPRQFHQLLQLAHLAIEVGQVEASHDIAQKISKRPLPDPEAPDSMRNRPSGFSYQWNHESAMRPSVNALKALMQKWGDKDSLPSVCCDLLLPIVFPPDQGVYLYSDQSRLLHLLHETPTNLASKLVDQARRADRLSQLKELLERRNSGVPPLIMMTQIAIAEKDYENAKRLLAKLHENYQAGKAIDILAINCQIAIPAFHVEELRDAALPILQELMLREKEGGNHPEASFKLFPLVREVDAYLLAKSKRQSEASEKQ